MTRAFACALLAWSLILGAVAPALADTAVGWIDELQGGSADFRLLRGGQPQVVSLFAPVFAGDEIQVQGENSVLVLGLGQEEFLNVTAAESPFMVPAPGLAPTLADNLLSWAGNGFANLERTAAVTVNASSRGYGESGNLCPDLDNVDRLSAPLLKGGPHALLPGQRALRLSWRGGYGPYTVRLVRSADSKVLLEASDVRSTDFSAQPVNLEPGEHVLTIEDIGGLTLSTILDVQEMNALPPLPAELANTSLPKTSLVLMEAAWLSSMENERWRFEAYQMLAAHEDYQPAQLLRQAMECGFTFGPPPARH